MKNIYFKSLFILLYRNVVVFTFLYLIGAFTYFSFTEPLKLITDIPNYTNGWRLAIFLFFTAIQVGVFKEIKDKLLDKEKKKAEAEMFKNRKDLTKEERTFLIYKRIKGSSLIWLDNDLENYYSENDVVNFLSQIKK